MNGINEILQAEQEAARIRREAKEAAEALSGSAEGYRQQVLDAARREGDAERERLLEDARQRAALRRKELQVLADVKNEELRQQAAQHMDETAAWIAERIAEV